MNLSNCYLAYPSKLVSLLPKILPKYLTHLWTVTIPTKITAVILLTKGLFAKLTKHTHTVQNTFRGYNTCNIRSVFSEDVCKISVLGAGRFPGLTVLVGARVTNPASFTWCAQYLRVAKGWAQNFKSLILYQFNAFTTVFTKFTYKAADLDRSRLEYSYILNIKVLKYITSYHLKSRVR